MKTRINKLTFKLPIVIFLLSLVSCGEDFLDLKNPNDITAETFFETPNDFQMAANTLYPSAGAIRQYFLQNSRAGDSEITTGAFAEQVTYSNFLNGATSGHSDGLYEGLFYMVYRANNILERMDDIDWTDNEDKKVSISGEAYFFRGLAYFYLAHSFGLVPIVTKVAVSAEEFNPSKASTVGEVYDQAIADLTQAKANLPEEQDDPGRVTKGAATGFLGKTYLFRASYLSENSNYALAAAEFKEVIDMGLYRLVTDYEDNFTSKNETNEESLFELQYKYAPGLGVQEQSRQFNSVPGIGYEIFLRPSAWLMGVMSQEKTTTDDYDPRYLQSVYFNDGLPLFGVPYNQLGDGLSVEGGGMVGGAPDGSSSTEGGWWRKYLNVHEPYEPAIGRGGDNNERILRYADILLMYAEAEVMAGGSLTDAAAAVQEVRDRANLPVKTYPNGNALMQEIIHQRVVEFAYENMLYFDLIRWNLLGDYIQDHGTDAQKENYDPVKHKYFPIPYSEIINNTNVEQNDPWK